MGAVTIRGLTKRYGAKTALAGLDLDVRDGEFFVVLGPSGAGKTTTLRSVAGLVDVDAGEVHIAGRNMAGVEPYHRNVAMAFESYALYPQKTVFENLASPLRSGRSGSYPPDQQRDRIDAVAGTLGIGALLERFPAELSNGQRQRVALGRVLVRPAEVYLLDEPLSHLDAKLRAQMRAELKQLGAMSSTTSLYVTHDYQEALALGDRLAVLRAGHLVQIGTPQALWHTPVDTFVARSLGQPEINLLAAEAEDGMLRAAAGAIALPVPPGTALSAGQRAQLGLRPRDLRLVPADDQTDGTLCFDGTVRLSERLGRLVELTVEVGGRLVVVVSEHGLREGERVRLQISYEHVHLFAAADGDGDAARLGSGAAQPQRSPQAATSGEGR
ncbi:ABC transporter ATP-binding protein [Plantactinospora sp. KBS50]|uniref:ABC transporter ATP-binding protein n=1 Tax=Plantactinospora sp. KBS50 TaxID=2024580 RepID=UPI000BAAE84B|nr:ABC transporter ATP-binding protein [Plantactinospora sp. KBS50]ASW53131.1 ABC transporter [Plantactinospora sp. KBS50]